MTRGTWLVINWCILPNLRRKIIFLHGMSAIFEDTFVLSGKGMWQKNSVIVAWVLEFIRGLIVLFRCTRDVQGQFDGDPLVDKMEECSLQC
jgi:hypothetical protein